MCGSKFKCVSFQVESDSLATSIGDMQFGGAITAKDICESSPYLWIEFDPSGHFNVCMQIFNTSTSIFGYFDLGDGVVMIESVDFVGGRPNDR